MWIALRSTGFPVIEEHWLSVSGLSVFRLCAVSRLTSVVCCTGIGCSVSTQVFGFGLCLVGVVLFVLLGCFLFCLPLFVLFLPGGFVALRMKLQLLLFVKQ